MTDFNPYKTEIGQDLKSKGYCLVNCLDGSGSPIASCFVFHPYDLLVKPGQRIGASARLDFGRKRYMITLRNKPLSSSHAERIRGLEQDLGGVKYSRGEIFNFNGNIMVVRKAEISTIAADLPERASLYT